MKEVLANIRFRLATGALIVLVGLGLLQVAPAAADTTTVTFTVALGGLTVDNAQTSVTLNNTAHTLLGSTISGSLGNITVSDLRNLTLGWAVTGSTTDFAHSNGTDSIAKAQATITQASTLVSSSGINNGGFVGGTATGVGGVIATAVTAGLLGSNTATFAPDMSITLPVGTPSGTYTGTFTTTVV